MSDENTETPDRPFADATGSANWRDACVAARKERLNRGLRTLASWAQRAAQWASMTAKRR
jgi:hypothetical protein